MKKELIIFLTVGMVAQADIVVRTIRYLNAGERLYG
jgi:hypothetical protein